MNTSDAFAVPYWLVRARRWLQARTADRPWLIDTSVPVLVALLLCTPDYVLEPDPSDARLGFSTPSMPLMLLLQAGLVVPLFWRRSRPVVTFQVVAAVFVLQWTLNIALSADMALLIALYSLASHGNPRRLALVVAAVAGTVTLMAVRVSAGVTFPVALFFLTSAATAAVALGLAVRIRRAQLQALRERAAQLEVERDQRGQLAAATERTRVAREIHDIIGHNLSVIITLSDGGASATDVNPARGKEALQLIGEVGRSALGELRRTLGALHEQNQGAELSPQPGIADVGPLCERIRAAGPDIVYHSSGDLTALDRGVQLAAYRIVQEALTNALKHASPLTEVYVMLTRDSSRLHIVVRDSGPPPSVPTPTPPSGEGRGLLGMRERAAIYGGTVLTGTHAGGGWRVEASLDLTAEAANMPSSSRDSSPER